MTTGEGFAVGAGVLLLGGVAYLGAQKLGAGNSAEVEALRLQAAQAQAALAEQQRQAAAAAAAQTAAQQAAVPNTGNKTVNNILGLAPGVIDLGTKIFSFLGK